MPNYKESQIAGSKWTRARRVVLNNPLDEVPTIVFEEEQVVQAGDLTVKQPVAPGPNTVVSGQFADPTTVFDLLDPETDTVTSTVTYAQFYAMVYSMYKHLAARRDTAVAALPALGATPVYDPATAPPAIRVVPSEPASYTAPQPAPAPADAAPVTPPPAAPTPAA